MINLDRFEEDGFAITAALFSSDEIRSVVESLEHSEQKAPERWRGGRRDVLDCVPKLRSMADHPSVRSIVQKILGPDAFVVRSTLFDKTNASNWKVPWHQDLTIAVTDRCDALGYGPWSTKAGVLHVQPPTQVLEQMATIRIHLDPCPAANGALRVQPGTHRLGRLNQNNVEKYIDELHVVICEAAPGEALVMRPLLLHASSASEIPGHRRVLHFDFATGGLADGLNWHMR